MILIDLMDIKVTHPCLIDIHKTREGPVLFATDPFFVYLLTPGNVPLTYGRPLSRVDKRRRLNIINFYVSILAKLIGTNRIRITFGSSNVSSSVPPIYASSCIFRNVTLLPTANEEWTRHAT